MLTDSGNSVAGGWKDGQGPPYLPRQLDRVTVCLGRRRSTSRIRTKIHVTFPVMQFFLFWALAHRYVPLPTFG